MWFWRIFFSPCLFPGNIRITNFHVCCLEFCFKDVSSSLQRSSQLHTRSILRKLWPGWQKLHRHVAVVKPSPPAGCYSQINGTEPLCLGTKLLPFTDAAPASRLGHVKHSSSIDLCVWFLRAGGHHELRGAAGRSGAGDGEGAVQGDQSGHTVGLHRCDRGPPAWWDFPVLPFPCALWKTGSAAIQGKSSECLIYSNENLIIYWISSLP